MNCSELTKKIPEYLGGEISPSEKVEMDRHFSCCSLCSQELKAYQGSLKKIREFYSSIPSEVHDDPLPYLPQVNSSVFFPFFQFLIKPALTLGFAFILYFVFSTPQTHRISSQKDEAGRITMFTLESGEIRSILSNEVMVNEAVLPTGQILEVAKDSKVEFRETAAFFFPSGTSFELVASGIRLIDGGSLVIGKPKHPEFSVFTSATVLNVRGTKFSVIADTQNTVVYVNDGLISLRTKNMGFFLEAGEIAWVRAGDAPQKNHAPDQKIPFTLTDSPAKVVERLEAKRPSSPPPEEHLRQHSSPSTEHQDLIPDLSPPFSSTKASATIPAAEEETTPGSSPRPFTGIRDSSEEVDSLYEND